MGLGSQVREQVLAIGVTAPPVVTSDAYVD